jgi:hypothetical protein
MKHREQFGSENPSRFYSSLDPALPLKLGVAFVFRCEEPACVRIRRASELFLFLNAAALLFVGGTGRAEIWIFSARRNRRGEPLPPRSVSAGQQWQCEAAYAQRG